MTENKETIDICARVWYEEVFAWSLRYMPEGSDAPANPFYGKPCWGLFDDDFALEQWATLDEAREALCKEGFWQGWYLPDHSSEGCVEIVEVAGGDETFWKVRR